MACVAGVVIVTASRVPAQAPSADARAATEAAIARGIELRNQQNPLGAKPYFQDAIDRATKLGDARLLQRAYDGMSEVVGDLSDWAGMLDYAQKMLDAGPDPTGSIRASYLVKRGRVMQELHERDQAMAAYDEALKLAQANGDRRRIAQLYNEVGLATWRFDRDKPKALKYYDESIATWKALGEDRNVAVVLNNSGNIFRYPETYPEAERRYREGIAAADRAGIDDDAFLMKNLGIVLRETGRREQAERTLKRAIEVADARGQARIQWQGRMELGTFYSTVDVAKAAEQFEGALAALEGLNNNVLLEGFRAGSLSGAVTIYDDPYDLYSDVLLNTGRERDAFFVAERARARAFLDTLSLARAEIATALPQGFVVEERQILERISKAQGAIRAEHVDPATRATLQAAIDAGEEQLSKIRVRLATEHPEIAHARYPRIAKVEDVQSTILKSDEILIEYFLGAKSGTMWAITPTGFHVRRLPPRAEIEAAVRPYLAAIANPEVVADDQAKSLAAMLLPDLEKIAGDRSHMIIVPNGILNYLPFETLKTTTGRYLIEERAVSYAPSTSSLAFLRNRNVTGTEVWAIGNPLMQTTGSDSERGQSISRVGYLKPLAFSGPEVRSVSSVYGNTAHIYEQSAATESILNGAEAANAGIIHIATHGLIDEEFPDRSGLALTASLPESDGILQMREVYRLKLSAALVTLSACQTALGKEVTGEGMVGLSRAFFYAGSNAVLASLWNVNDASTSRLMRPFYEALSRGQSIDESLRAAKIAMLRSGGRTAHPYYWAAFVVTGNGTAQVPVSPRMSWISWQIGLVAAVALAGGALVWRRVR